MFLQLAVLMAIMFLPYLLTRLTIRMGTQIWLSPVVLSYAAGIAIGNFSLVPLPVSISEIMSQVTILLAIPMLLYSTDLIAWFKMAKVTILSFLLVIASVLVSVSLVGVLFREQLAEPWLLSGMMAGVFIGGTPNMNAVGIALGADSATFIKLNAAEIVCGGIYLLFLTSVAHRFYGYFLPDFKGEKKTAFDISGGKVSWHWKEILTGLGLTLILCLLSVGLVYLIYGRPDKPGLIILLISFFGVLASFSPKVRNLDGVFEAGEYLLLMFCVAIGMMANFGELWESGGMWVLFASSVMLVAIILHLLLCRLFGIDRDTMMITQTAGFYGPPFIGQIAAVIQNRNIVFSGIATGLVGLAVANFLGVLVAKVLAMING